jgi:hypothetical protein
VFFKQLSLFLILEFFWKHNAEKERKISLNYVIYILNHVIYIWLKYYLALDCCALYLVITWSVLFSHVKFIQGDLKRIFRKITSGLKIGRRHVEAAKKKNFLTLSIRSWSKILRFGGYIEDIIIKRCIILLKNYFYHMYILKNMDEMVS